MPLACARPLLATEHTEFDAGAERIALDLARARGVSLAVVVPIVSNSELEAIAPGLVARAESQVRERLAALEDDAARRRVPFEIRVRRGEEPWREIVAEAKARDADLIVIRRRGRRSFLANLLVGGMVGKVGTAAPCDVLMVPRAARLWTTRVLAGVDGTRAGAAVARAAAQAAGAAGLPLTVVSVAAHDAPADRAAAESAVSAAVTVASGEGVAVEARVAVGRPAEAIVSLASAAGADLLVVGRSDPSAHDRLHFGSTAERVVGLASGAVLVVTT